MDNPHKLYDLQVTPPQGVWENIAKELEEIEQYKKIGTRLGEMEAIPPSGVWEQIAGSLNEEITLENVAKKLYALEVAPPASVWNNIESQLPQRGTKSKVIAMPIYRRAWAKYAVAASVVGIIGLFAYFMNRGGEADVKNMMATLHTEKVQSPATITETEPAQSTKTHIDEINAPLPMANATPTAANILKTPAGNTYSTTVEKNKEINGRYIVLMTENGDIVRMSKKMGELADCVAGEDPTAGCNHQIEKWQKELAHSPVSAMPDDFLEILELANQENGM